MSVTSRMPAAARRSASATIAATGRETFRAPRVGDDAEGAELVAALLDREEGRDAAAARLRRRRRRQAPELVLERKLRVDDAAPGGGAVQQLRQAVIALRPDHHVDDGGAADDLLPLGLGDAARHHDGGAAAVPFAFALQRAHAAKLGIDLLGRFLADMAGVEDDEVRLLHRGGFAEPFRREDVGHALGVIGVHLAAVGLDEDFFHEDGPARAKQQRYRTALS